MSKIITNNEFKKWVTELSSKYRQSQIKFVCMYFQQWDVNSFYNIGNIFIASC